MMKFKQAIRMNALLLYVQLNSLGPSFIWLVGRMTFRILHYYLDVGASN